MSVRDIQKLTKLMTLVGTTAWALGQIKRAL